MRSDVRVLGLAGSVHPSDVFKVGVEARGRRGGGDS